MKSTKGLIAAILGVAMLAAPITAAAADHHRTAGANARAAASAPRSNNIHNFASARSSAASGSLASRVFNTNRGTRAASWSRHRDFDDRGSFAANSGVVPIYPSYGYTNSAPMAGYVAPAPEVGFAAPGYGSPCTTAQRAINIARHDRRTGHPAAANDVLRNNSQALASCPEANGLPAYGSYGYNAPYQASPYGYGASTMLAPLLQNFIR
jgi:hypothetical protein